MWPTDTGWLPFLAPNQQHRKTNMQSRALTELVHGSHTRDNYVPVSSPLIRHQLHCRGDHHGDEHAGRSGERTLDHSACMGRWSGVHGEPCECAAGESRGMTCHTRCMCAASPGVSETHATCTHAAPFTHLASNTLVQ